MKTIINFIKKAIAWTEQTMLALFPYDKCLHTIAGILIFTLACPFVGQSFAMILAFTAAVCKGIYDKLVKKTMVDTYDILYTVAPAIYIILYNYLMKL